MQRLFYLGDGEVIHKTSDQETLYNAKKSSLSDIGRKTEKAVVKRSKIWDVASGSKVYKNNTHDIKER